MSTWTLNDQRVIDLLTPEAFAALPDGASLMSINGVRHIKGKDPINGDTRGGYMAFGLTRPTPPARPALSLKDGNAVQVYEGDGQAPRDLVDEYLGLIKRKRALNRGAGGSQLAAESAIMEEVVALWAEMTPAERMAADPRHKE